MEIDANICKYIQKQHDWLFLSNDRKYAVTCSPLPIASLSNRKTFTTNKIKVWKIFDVRHLECYPKKIEKTKEAARDINYQVSSSGNNNNNMIGEYYLTSFTALSTFFLSTFFSLSAIYTSMIQAIRYENIQRHIHTIMSVYKSIIWVTYNKTCIWDPRWQTHDIR